jgi:hypothetical protein
MQGPVILSVWFLLVLVVDSCNHSRDAMTRAGGAAHAGCAERAPAAQWRALLPFVTATGRSAQVPRYRRNYDALRFEDDGMAVMGFPL